MRRSSTPTPTFTRPEEWARYDDCHICQAKPRQPCRNLHPRVGVEVVERHRPHNERRLLVDRDLAGRMVLGRREHVTASRPGTTHGAHAHHASINGAAVCSGALLDTSTFRSLERLTIPERCQRNVCRKVWLEEELR